MSWSGGGGSGSGTGWAGEVANFAALPAATGSGDVYLVENSTGFLWNRRKGFYRDEGVGTWNRLSNATFEVLDNEATFSDNADDTKKMQFQLDEISTGTTRTMSFPDRNSNISRTLLARIRNVSGSQIDKGQVIYSPGIDSGLPTVELADSYFFAKSRFIGVVDEDLPNNSNGYALFYGALTDIDTSSWAAGDVLYLKNDGSGNLTDQIPTNGSFACKIGQVIVSDTTNGVINVYPSTSDLTVEITDTNGFPTDQRTGTTISFVDGTRTFTIAPTGSDFHYYILGVKYEKTASDSVVISDVEGLHAIYYDGSTLTAIANPDNGQIDSLIRAKAIVAYVYWNATDSQSNYFGDERHGISMSPETHSYLHFTRGAQFLSGLALNTITVDQSGDVNSHSQFGVDSGFYTDEDLIISTSSIASTTGLSIYYLDGASANLRKITNSGYSVLDDVTAGVDTTGRLVYNEFTGATWQLSTVSNNDFVLCHIFAINGTDSTDQIIAFIGQGDYGTLGQARDGSETEISNLLIQIPLEEIIPIGTIIFQTSDGYANAVKARIRSTDTGDDYIDWRTSELSAGAAPTSHNNLANLELANTGVTYGHIDDQAQSIYGVKTFTSNVFMSGLKSGTSQVNAGAAANELWVDTADNSIKIGV
jgi:hypothetical protein